MDRQNLAPKSSAKIGRQNRASKLTAKIDCQYWMPKYSAKIESKSNAQTDRQNKNEAPKWSAKLNVKI